MSVTAGRLPTMTASVGWPITLISTGPGNVWTFWDSTTPAYRIDASPIAASLSGQLWTTIARARVTAALVRPPQPARHPSRGEREWRPEGAGRSVGTPAGGPCEWPG